jgi:hypothetical protein
MKPELQEYYYKHRLVLEQMKQEAIATIPCQRATTKMWYECSCGATVVAKNLQFHFLSLKHREKCGSLDNVHVGVSDELLPDNPENANSS